MSLFPTIAADSYREPQDEARPYEGQEIEAAPHQSKTIVIDPDSGATVTHNDDGSLDFDFGGKSRAERTDAKFDDNLAEDMDEMELDQLASELLEGIDTDMRSSEQWRAALNRGIDLLGLKIEEATGEIGNQGSVSQAVHPLLLEAVVRQQSNDHAEMLPSNGPVKVRDDNPDQTQERFSLAEAFEKDFNYYLTVVAKEYFPDTDRMLFVRALSGMGIKKVYRDPIKRRPVSISVPPQDVIVSNDAISFTDAGRVTHRSMMRHSTMKRMQIIGHYRQVDLMQPNEQPTSVEEKIKSIEGIIATPQIPADHRYTILECYCELDLDEKDAPEGLPLPYRVTLDKDSQKILEIRRNWKQGDEDYMTRRRFVKFGFVPGLGFYDYGYVHLLGNTARSLTAIERILIDAGQFSCFPGFLISKNGQRQETNQIRVPPGGGHEIDTGGNPIQDTVMAIPYKEPSAVLVAIAKQMADDGQRLGGTADIQVGEGRADIPVGTTMALIEQSTKVMSAVHKRSHAAQQEELELLKELFSEEPEALSRFIKRPARQWQVSEEFDDLELVPASDPNVPSHIHRLMLATAIMQISTQAAGVFDPHKIASFVFKTIGAPPATDFFAPPQPPQQPPADPAKMAQVQLDAKAEQREAAQAVLEGHIRMQELQTEDNARAADRASREKVANMKLEAEKIKAQGGLRAKVIDAAVSHSKAQSDADATKHGHIIGHHADMVDAGITHQGNVMEHRGGLINAAVAHHGKVLEAGVNHHGNLLKAAQADKAAKAAKDAPKTPSKPN